MEVIEMRGDNWRKVISLFLLAVFLGLACNFSGSNKITTQVEEESASGVEIPEYMDGEATYLVTALPREDNKIILMIVEPSSEGNLAKVTMLLPNHLAGIEVYANDIQVDALELEVGKGVVFDLTEKVSAKEVAFIFQSGGDTLATCTITTGRLLTPEGDCMW
jgi:hypothetical protein